MNKYEKFQLLLKTYYKQLKSSTVPAKTEECISNEECLNYVLKELDEDYIKKIEKHLSKCDYCLSNIKKLSKIIADSDIKLDKEPSKELILKIRSLYNSYFYEDIVYNLKVLLKDNNIQIFETDGIEGNETQYKYRIEKEVIFKIDEEKQIELILDYDGSKKINLKIKFFSKANTQDKYDILFKQNNNNFCKPVKSSINEFNIIKDIPVPAEYQLSVWYHQPYYINISFCI